MKFLIVMISSCMILSCGFAGFQPPKQYFAWYLHNKEKLIPSSDPDSLIKYVDKQEKDMRACGIDPVVGESDSAEAALCMESKGWYLKSGPACEDQLLRDDPLCVQWRAKRKR